MATTVITPLVAGIAASLAPAALDYAKSAVIDLIKRSSEAEEEYRRTAHLDEFATARQENLDHLAIIRSQATLNVSDLAFLQRILTWLLALHVRTYEATTEQQLAVISTEIGQIESFLDRYDKEQVRRNNIRVVAIIVFIIVFAALFSLAIIGSSYGLQDEYVVPIFQIPLSVLLWGALGSITAILYRFNTGGDAELTDPLRWIVTRPLTGVMMATLVYLAVKIGYVAAAGSTPADGAANNELIWLVSFLIGFSDRFTDHILSSLVGRFGGSTEQGLVNTPGMLGNHSLLETLETWTKESRTTVQAAIEKESDPVSEIPAEDGDTDDEAKPPSKIASVLPETNADVEASANEAAQQTQIEVSDPSDTEVKAPPIVSQQLLETLETRARESRATVQAYLQKLIDTESEISSENGETEEEIKVLTETTVHPKDADDEGGGNSDKKEGNLNKNSE